MLFHKGRSTKITEKTLADKKKLYQIPKIVISALQQRDNMIL